MRFEKKISRKNGNPIYSFLYWCPKTKKRIRLRRTEIPSDITSDDQAREFARIKEAELKAFSIKVKRELQWKSQYYDFAQLLDLYASKRKVEAPNSWENDVYYLEQYVFTFFLSVKRCNNLNNWDLHFEALRDWLEHDAEPLKTKVGKPRLEYSTKNYCIKSMNRFLDTMARLQKMKSPPPRCSVFPKHKLNRKGIESVLSNKEIEVIHRRLSDINADSAAMFWVLCHTGLRLNECLGLALSHVFKGEPQDKTLRLMLNQFKLKSRLHIVLDSQPCDSSGPRAKDGTVPRKPLKSKKRIEPRNNRIIPLIDKQAITIIVGRFNEQAKQFKAKLFGKDKLNYLLFDGLDKNTFSNHLRKAYKESGFSHKSPHSCRHTYCTNMVASTLGHPFLAKYVLGHSDPKTTENYLHLWEQIQRNIAQDHQVEDSLDLNELFSTDTDQDTA